MEFPQDVFKHIMDYTKPLKKCEVIECSFVATETCIWCSCETCKGCYDDKKRSCDNCECEVEVCMGCESYTIDKCELCYVGICKDCGNEGYYFVCSGCDDMIDE